MRLRMACVTPAAFYATRDFDLPSSPPVHNSHQDPRDPASTLLFSRRAIGGVVWERKSRARPLRCENPRGERGTVSSVALRTPTAVGALIFFRRPHSGVPNYGRDRPLLAQSSRNGGPTSRVAIVPLHPSSSPLRPPARRGAGTISLSHPRREPFPSRLENTPLPLSKAFPSIRGWLRHSGQGRRSGPLVH